jgi:Mg-chelatase subunit ChlD
MSIRSRESGGERGAILVAMALFLMLLIAFAALATEVGRWYVVRAELSKSVDAGALAGARNISNPYVDPQALAREFAYANFAFGSLGTPGSGGGAVAFSTQATGGTRIQVDGTVNATPLLARIFGVSSVPVVSRGVAQKNAVEMLMVLDRSGSMDGQPMRDLKRAARSFLGYFAETQAQDKVGLVSFATSVRVDRAVGTNFVTAMGSAIDAMSAVGATNMEDALARADGAGGLTDQAGVPAESRVRQFVILFTDGNPTAFRGQFKKKGRLYDAVACVTGDGGSDDIVYQNLGRPSQETWLGVDPTQPGNGGNGNGTTKWYIFEKYPVPGHGAEDTNIRNDRGGAFMKHVLSLSRGLALQDAQALKDAGVTVYAIGLGAADRSYLATLASGPDLVYYAPTSDQLQAIFQKVAQDIKLRLVQ